MKFSHCEVSTKMSWKHFYFTFLGSTSSTMSSSEYSKASEIPTSSKIGNEPNWYYCRQKSAKTQNGGKKSTKITIPGFVIIFERNIGLRFGF